MEPLNGVGKRAPTGRAGRAGLALGLRQAGAVTLLGLCLATGCAREPAEPDSASGTAQESGAGPRGPGGWTPCLRLFDLAPHQVLAGEAAQSEALRARLAEPEVTILDELVRGPAMSMETPRFSDRGTWLFSGRTRFPSIGDKRLVKAERAMNPGAGKPTKRDVPAEPGQVLIGPAGVKLLRDVPEKRDVTVSYQTASTALEAEMFSPPDGPGELPLSSGRTLGVVTHRASLVGAPSRLAWRVELPPSARLELSYGVNGLGIGLRPEGVELSPGLIGAVTLRVELRRMSGPAHAGGEAQGDAEVLFERRLAPGQAARYNDLDLDLAAWSGDWVELALVAEQVGRDADGPPAFPLWGEPILSTVNESTPPNVLVILLDTLRADRLGCYGWERARTRSLDRLAEEGVRFEHAYSGASWTLPSHATLFTSQHASEHGLWRRDHRLGEEATTLAEVLGQYGYRTAAFTEGGFVRAIYGLAQGFDDFQAKQADVRATFATALDWMSAAPAPWFCFAQTYSVHSPYQPPKFFRKQLVRPYDGELPEVVSPPDYPWGRNQENTLTAADEQYLQDLYDAEIAFADRAVGNLLEALEERGLRENTVIVVTSDHGEEFGDHGHFEHGFSLYEEQVRVPLIVHAPGHFEGGLVAEHPVQGVDLAPTLAQLAGAPVPDDWRGVPLSPEPPATERPVFLPFFTRADGEPCVALRVGDLKYIDFTQRLRPSDPHPQELLFELAADPGERSNLFEAESGEDQLERWRQAAEDFWETYPLRFEAGSSALSPELQAELQALGYLDG